MTDDELRAALHDAEVDLKLAEYAKAVADKHLASASARIIRLGAMFGGTAPVEAKPAAVQTGVMLTLEQAAERLGIGTKALEARCRRAQRKESHNIVARLGAGVTAMKFGVSWRFRFEEI